MAPTTPSKGVQVLTLKIDELYIDPKYQRKLNDKFVQRIAEEFDDKMLGTLVVNKRDDGVKAVVDGQHRMEGAKMAGRKNLPCVVFSIDPEAEGSLFTALQRDRRPVTPIERHKALVYSKEDLAVRIDRITNHAGFKIETGDIGSITSIREYAERGWPLENYKKALNTIKETWPKDTQQRVAFEVVMGLYMFFQRAGNRATVVETVDALFDYMPRAIVRDAKLMNANDEELSRIGAAAWVIAKQFNKHHRRRGTQAVSRELFTGTFRAKSGWRTRKLAQGVDTGAGHRNEFRSPLSTGDDAA